MLFELIMQQSYLCNQFDFKFYQIATITTGLPIKFVLQISAKLYLDLNNFPYIVRCRNVKKDGTNMPEVNACKTTVNLLFNSLFKEVIVSSKGTADFKAVSIKCQDMSVDKACFGSMSL